ncbi:DUF2809 domain-containing protein [Microbacterium sp. A93]|uniref:ribosomal maturation YjgA family protein n=1 Tax=Microbacterium sp. A93 TaxID=3450716 RepID=UPI003F435824
MPVPGPGPAPHPTTGRSASGPGRRRALTRRWTRRLTLAAAAVATVGLGLGVRSLADGAWAGPAGDVLYAVLIYLLVAWAVPRWTPRTVAGVAVVLCWLIELFQLTGVPLLMAEAWWPARLVFGTGFAGADLLSYAAGCAAAGAGDAAWTRWTRWTRQTRRRW